MWQPPRYATEHGCDQRRLIVSGLCRQPAVASLTSHSRDSPRIRFHMLKTAHRAQQRPTAPTSPHIPPAGAIPPPLLQRRKRNMSLRDVLVDELRDLYSAEKQLVKALPKMAKGAGNKEVKTLFTEHLQQTRDQVDRLKQIFQQLEEKPAGELCKGMEGLVAEGNEQLESEEEGAAKDVCIAGAALRIEHYEIAGYTAAIAIAKTLGEREIVSLLTETLNEEAEAGKKILAASKPLLKEASAEDEEEDEDEQGVDEEEEA
jgi:ferritin-like metal-binding protein YciE